jgi:hypothetical protein
MEMIRSVIGLGFVIAAVWILIATGRIPIIWNGGIVALVSYMCPDPTVACTPDSAVVAGYVPFNVVI